MQANAHSHNDIFNFPILEDKIELYLPKFRYKGLSKLILELSISDKKDIIKTLRKNGFEAYIKNDSIIAEREDFTFLISLYPKHVYYLKQVYNEAIELMKEHCIKLNLINPPKELRNLKNPIVLDYNMKDYLEKIILIYLKTYVKSVINNLYIVNSTLSISPVKS